MLRGSEAGAASLWPLEVANGLLAAKRRGRLTSADAERCLGILLALPIAIDPVTLSRAPGSTRALATKHRLSAYDASYLELAVRLGVPLATRDGALRAAAQVEGVVMLGA